MEASSIFDGFKRVLVSCKSGTVQGTQGLPEHTSWVEHTENWVRRPPRESVQGNLDKFNNIVYVTDPYY